MNDVCRARRDQLVELNVASLVKICRSGQNRIRVPVDPLHPLALAQARPRVEAAPGPSPSNTPGTPRWKDMALVGRAAVDVDVEPGGQRVDDRGADAVQAAGGDVGAAAELAAGVQLGEDHLDAGQAGLGLLVDRDAAAVVVDLDRAVGVQGDLDPLRVAGQGLVDAVVDDLPQAVHEPAGVGGPDVHARPLADGLEPLEDEEVVGVVGVVDLGPSGGAGWHGAPCGWGGGGSRTNLPATRPPPETPRLPRMGVREATMRASHDATTMCSALGETGNGGAPQGVRLDESAAGGRGSPVSPGAPSARGEASCVIGC